MRTSLVLLSIAMSLGAFLAGYFTLQNSDISLDLQKGSILDKFQIKDLGVEDSKLIKLSDKRAVSITDSLLKDNIIYYEKSTGKVFEINPATKEERVVSESILNNFIKAVWSPVTREVVGIFSDRGELRFRYYNHESKETFNLDTDIKSITFSPDGKNIAYFKKVDNLGLIYIAKPNGDSPEKLITTRLDNIEVSWPKEDMLALRVRGQNHNYTIYTLSVEGALTKVLESKENPKEKWSPSGNKIIFSETDRFGKRVLFYKNLGILEKIQLNISSFGSKCAWSRDEITIVCGERDNSGTDSIYKINIETNKKELLYDHDTTINITSGIMTNLGNFFVFINALDGKLYALKLTTSL